MISFVLAHLAVISGDFLIGAGNDNVGGVHGDEVRDELAGEMMAGIVITPVEIAVEMFTLLQRVGNVALGDINYQYHQ